MDKKVEVILQQKYHDAPIDVWEKFKRIVDKLDLDPLNDEVIIGKNGGDDYYVQITRSGYRIVAQREASYASHFVAPLYENDTLTVIDGVPHHEKALRSKGDLVGAYGVLKKKGSQTAFYWQIEFDEYNTGEGWWSKDDGKPATMICKVCESQMLRMAYQHKFSGTYDQIEILKKQDGDHKRREKALTVLRQHEDLAEKYFDDRNLNLIPIDELEEIVRKVEAELAELKK